MTRHLLGPGRPRVADMRGTEAPAGRSSEHALRISGQAGVRVVCVSASWKAWVSARSGRAASSLSRVCSSPMMRADPLRCAASMAAMLSWAAPGSSRSLTALTSSSQPWCRSRNGGQTTPWTKASRRPECSAGSPASRNEAHAYVRASRPMRRSSNWPSGRVACSPETPAPDRIDRQVISAVIVGNGEVHTQPETRAVQRPCPCRFRLCREGTMHTQRLTSEARWLAPGRRFPCARSSLAQGLHAHLSDIGWHR
jgi:hypothetical protein